MAPTTLSRVTARTAAEICRFFELEPPAQALLTPAASPAAFLDVLVANSQFPDAVRMLAHALGRREAVWWTCVCTRASNGVAMTPPAAEALKAAEAWVMEPGEDARRAAGTAGLALGTGHPAGCAAMGAFFSGGSMAPPNVPPVPPDPLLTARVVAAGVMLAAVAGDAKAAGARYVDFVARAVDIANGGNGTLKGGR